MNDHDCTTHDPKHVHAPGCGHPRVKHDDHFDFLVDGHLHYVTDAGCVCHGTPASKPRSE